MHHTVRDAMTANPTTVEGSTTAEEAARTMKSEDVGSLPILDGNRLVGVITDRDLTLRVLGEGRAARRPSAKSLRRTSSRSIRSRAWRKQPV